VTRQVGLRKTIRERLHELRVWWRELDSSTLPPRIAALAFLAGGLLAIAVGQVVPDFDGGARMETIAVASALFGAVALLLPWQRWPASAQVVYALFAFVLFAWGGMIESGTAGPYLAALPLPFVYMGFTQRPGMSILLVPFAALALVVAARFTVDSNLLTALLFALPMSVLVGETIAQAQQHRARAEHRVDRLLDVVRVFARVENERIGAQLVAARTAELLDAQAVAVLLNDRPGSNRYLNRAFFGHPALADAAPLLMESVHSEGRGAGRTRFVALRREVGAVRAAAILELPGTDGRALGLVIAMWGTPRRRLNPPVRQAAELLSEEAGRMFQRLRESAALEHDAQTDPLTDLANRRTFTRALQTLQPGDALVIVDLDHFKTVNDRFGHETGDKTLRALARCLRETARQVDTVARYGGEEFALVLPGSGAEGAETMLERTREVWDQLHPVTTFSAGIAVHTEGRDPSETMRRADTALYEAKDAGRNRTVLAESEIILP
jgi:diguanylate cyclase (GGDEF)-like protein